MALWALLIIMFFDYRSVHVSHKEVVFGVTARNAAGLAETESFIHIPNQHSLVDVQPRNLVKTLLDEVSYSAWRFCLYYFCCCKIRQFL